MQQVTTTPLMEKTVSGRFSSVTTMLLEPSVFHPAAIAKHSSWWHVLLPVAAPLMLVSLWLVLPLSKAGSKACSANQIHSQSVLLELLFHAVYVGYSAGQAYAFLIVVRRPCVSVRVCVCAVSGLLAALSRHVLNKLGANNLFLFVLNTILWTSLPQLVLQYTLIRVRGSSNNNNNKREMERMWWSQGLLCVIIMWYTWCESNLWVMKNAGYRSWHTPVFLPVVFGLGLSLLRLIGRRFIASRLSRMIEDDLMAEPDTPDLNPEAPFVLLEIAYQYFYFIFYRQLFFTVDDPMSMAILQMNAMVLDTINALSSLRFSSVVRSGNHVMFIVDMKHIESQGIQLAFRQLARVTSLIAVVGFATWIRYGYNHCFFDHVEELSETHFSRLIANFFIMFAWELLFVLALGWVLKKSLGLDLVGSIKDVVSSRWVCGLLIAQTTHYLSDPYFGLHREAL